MIFAALLPLAAIAMTRTRAAIQRRAAGGERKITRPRTTREATNPVTGCGKLLAILRAVLAPKVGSQEQEEAMQDGVPIEVFEHSRTSG